MKLQIVSDLHMEFRDPPNIINAGADVLLLAGDICLVDHLYKNPNTYALPSRGVYAKDATRYRDFFNHVSQEFDSVYYVLGNHEYYQGRWNNTVERLRSELEPWPNIVLMDNTWINIGDTRIIGTSLWTDLNNANPLVMEGVRFMMNDYRSITIEILGHHAPSHKSIHPKYQNQDVMNHAFVNRLDEYIIDHPQIKLWVHGHVHDCWDYMIGDTRIVCNPRGYPGETNGFNPNLIVEI